MNKALYYSENMFKSEFFALPATVGKIFLTCKSYALSTASGAGTTWEILLFSSKFSRCWSVMVQLPMGK